MQLKVLFGVLWFFHPLCGIVAVIWNAPGEAEISVYRLHFGQIQVDQRLAHWEDGTKARILHEHQSTEAPVPVLRGVEALVEEVEDEAHVEGQRASVGVEVVHEILEHLPVYRGVVHSHVVTPDCLVAVTRVDEDDPASQKPLPRGYQLVQLFEYGDVSARQTLLNPSVLRVRASVALVLEGCLQQVADASFLTALAGTDAPKKHLSVRGVHRIVFYHEGRAVDSERFPFRY